jgi:hypothetical protein
MESVGSSETLVNICHITHRIKYLSYYTWHEISVTLHIASNICHITHNIKYLSHYTLHQISVTLHITSNICHITHYIKSNSNFQSPPWEPCRHFWALKLANLSLFMLVIFSANFAKCTQTVKEASTVESLVSERWLSWSPIIRFGLALQVNFLRNLKTYLSLKLPAIGSSTV